MRRYLYLLHRHAQIPKLERFVVHLEEIFDGPLTAGLLKHTHIVMFGFASACVPVYRVRSFLVRFIVL